MVKNIRLYAKIVIPIWIILMFLVVCSIKKEDQGFLLSQEQFYRMEIKGTITRTSRLPSFHNSCYIFFKKEASDVVYMKGIPSKYERDISIGDSILKKANSDDLFITSCDAILKIK